MIYDFIVRDEFAISGKPFDIIRFVTFYTEIEQANQENINFSRKSNYLKRTRLQSITKVETFTP